MFEYRIASLGGVRTNFLLDIDRSWDALELSMVPRPAFRRGLTHLKRYHDVTHQSIGFFFVSTTASVIPVHGPSQCWMLIPNLRRMCFEGCHARRQYTIFELISDEAYEILAMNMNESNVVESFQQLWWWLATWCSFTMKWIIPRWIIGVYRGAGDEWTWLFPSTLKWFHRDCYWGFIGVRGTCLKYHFQHLDGLTGFCGVFTCLLNLSTAAYEHIISFIIGTLQSWGSTTIYYILPLNSAEWIAINPFAFNQISIGILQEIFFILCNCLFSTSTLFYGFGHLLYSFHQLLFLISTDPWKRFLVLNMFVRKCAGNETKFLSFNVTFTINKSSWDYN